MKDGKRNLSVTQETLPYHKMQNHSPKEKAGDQHFLVALGP